MNKITVSSNPLLKRNEKRLAVHVNWLYELSIGRIRRIDDNEYIKLIVSICKFNLIDLAKLFCEKLGFGEHLLFYSIEYDRFEIFKYSLSLYELKIGSDECYLAASYSFDIYRYLTENFKNCKLACIRDAIEYDNIKVYKYIINSNLSRCSAKKIDPTGYDSPKCFQVYCEYLKPDNISHSLMITNNYQEQIKNWTCSIDLKLIDILIETKKYKCIKYLAECAIAHIKTVEKEVLIKYDSDYTPKDFFSTLFSGYSGYGNWPKEIITLLLNNSANTEAIRFLLDRNFNHHSNLILMCLKFGNLNCIKMLDERRFAWPQDSIQALCRNPEIEIIKILNLSQDQIKKDKLGVFIYMLDNHIVTINADAVEILVKTRQIYIIKYLDSIDPIFFNQYRDIFKKSVKFGKPTYLKTINEWVIKLNSSKNNYDSEDSDSL